MRIEERLCSKRDLLEEELVLARLVSLDNGGVLVVVDEVVAASTLNLPEGREGRVSMADLAHSLSVFHTVLMDIR